MKKLLVTGSSGLIGSESVVHFENLGWQVYGIDNIDTSTVGDISQSLVFKYYIPQYLNTALGVDNDGEGNFLEEPVSIGNYELEITNYELSNYPNPFNPTTTISFMITQNSDFVTLEIFNVKGRKIKDLSPSLCHPEFIEGRGETKYSVVWNGTNENNQPVCSGVYLYKLKVNGKTEVVKKCLLLK